jgi:hypothetical protein
VIGVPFAHVGGVPIEESLGAVGPVLISLGVAWRRLRAHLRAARRGSAQS